MYILLAQRRHIFFRLFNFFWELIVYVQVYLFIILYSYWIATNIIQYLLYLVVLVYKYLYVFTQPWQKLPTGGHGYVICMDNLGGVFSHVNTPIGHTETHRRSFFPYKQVSGRNGDHEWLRMTNAFILCDLVWKVKKMSCSKQRR